jgi:hypothetical protein
MDLISILFSYSPSSYSLVIFYLTNFYVLTHSLTHSLLTTYSQALYGVDYFHAELERRSQRAALAAAPATVSQVHAP